jgi:hypothetical protein
MDRRLHDLATGHGGVFSSADATRAGADAETLRRLVARGEVVRVRRGAFVLTESMRSATPEERYRLRVRAVLRSRPPHDAASHHAALSVHGLPLFRVDLGVVDVDARVSRVRLQAGVRSHPGGPGRVQLVEGTRAVVAATACVQTAAASGVVSGVCAMDGALHAKACDRADLEAALPLLPAAGRAVAARAVAATDPACESVGESRTRLVLTDLGFRVVSQVVVVAGPVVLGRVDFLVDDLVVVEFDGLVKYEGLDGKAALAAEKARESRIVDAGYEVERLVWRDLDRTAELGRRIRVAKFRATRRREASA